MSLNAADLTGCSIVINNLDYLVYFPNNASPDCISIYNPLSKKFLCHCQGRVIEADAKTAPGSFPAASSFVPEPVPGGLRLRAAVPELAGSFICTGHEGLILAPLPSRAASAAVFPLIRDLPGSLAFMGSALEVLQKQYTSLGMQYTELDRRFSLEPPCAQLRNFSGSMAKKPWIVFVGGGADWNLLYVFRQLYTQLHDAAGPLPQLKYFAADVKEKALLERLGLPCELWDCDNLSEILYALQAKVAVFSSLPAGSRPETQLLFAAVYGACKIRLIADFWPGRTAAEAEGAGGFAELAQLLEECCVNIAAVPLGAGQFKEKYARCYPGAAIVCTGSAGTDALFRENAGTWSGTLSGEWYAQNRGRLKLLMVPALRDTPEGTAAYLDSLSRFYLQLKRENIAAALYLQPGFCSGPGNLAELKQKLENQGICILPEEADPYGLMNKFDAMLSDWHSLRFDFALTGKPLLLFRPDPAPCRLRSGLKLWDELEALDAAAYPADTRPEELAELLRRDPLKPRRLEALQKLGVPYDGKAARRLAELILSRV